MINEIVDRMARRIASYCYAEGVLNSQEGNWIFSKEKIQKVVNWNTELEIKVDYHFICLVVEDLYCFEGVCDVLYGDNVEDGIALDINFYTDFLPNYKFNLEDEE